MVVILVVLLASTAVQAKLQLVENFDSMATGKPDGIACTGVMGGTWDTDSEGTGNVNIEDRDASRVLQFRGHSSGDRRGVGFNGITNTIDNSEAGKVFLRFMLRSSSETPRTYIGLISDASNNPITSTSVNAPTDIPAGFGLLDNGSGGFDLVKTDGTTVLKAGLARTQWYNVWIVADNDADTFDLYLSEATGPAGEATLPNPEDLVERSIPFGVATTDPLNGMIFACPAGTGQSTRTYVDEIWWDGDQGLKKPTKARNPSPANKEPDVPRDVVLSWTSGPFAATHNVYFGTSFDDVSNADTSSPLLVGPAQAANTYDLGRLDFNKTYYWRVDEVNGPPDHTVFEGKVWSFITELIAYPVENITATASSSDVDKGPENTINGSGLDDSGLLHGKDAENNVWLSSMAGPQPTWIEYEFDRVYKLYEMWVWNSNQSLEPVIGLGFKDVSIEYSANGIDYTTLGTTHEFARAPGTPDYAHNTTVDLSGVAAKYVKLTANSNWGGILNQYGLSEVRFFYIPVHATEPSPESGATDVDVDVTLGWRTGREAVEHHLYLSTDEQAVIDGNAPVTITTETSYGPLSLDLGLTYYWKINEVNMAETPTTSDGDLWSFTTQQYLVVDDFESYNDLDPGDPESNRIFFTWLDGYDVATNGSIVGYDVPPFTEQSIVYGGKQAMPFFYDNSGTARYSEAELTLSPAQDWTKHGITVLSLQFCGDPNNAVEQMYVKLNGSKVVYDGDAGDIQRGWYEPWNIDVASFGVSLQNVTKLSIGVGDETSTTPGGSGVVYVDDIRLYRLVPGPPEGIWFEAEAADSITPPMEIYDHPAASGGKYISTDESVGDSSDVPPAPAGTASYIFAVEGGTYKVSCRINIPGGSNSFWVRIQGATIPIETELDPSGWVRWNGLPDAGNWYWHDVFSDDDDENATVLFTMPAGTHTLEIGYREDAAMLDAIVISKID